MHAAAHFDGAAAQGLGAQLVLRPLGQRGQHRRPLGHALGAQTLLHRLLANQALIGQPHAVGRQDACQRMHQHPRHAQGIGHEAGMLTARAAKALQGVTRHVVAARDRNFLDGIGHLLHRNLYEAFGHGFRLQPRAGVGGGLDGVDQLGKLRLHDLGIERFIAARAKHFREMLGLNFAHHHIGIGHGQRPTAAVARWPRVGACAFRAHTKASTIKLQNGAATGRHRVNAHHGRAHAHTGHLGFKLTLELACKVADIGGGATHVKANHPGLARQALAMGKSQLGRARHAHNATGRARQNGVFALKRMGVGQAPRRLHEVKRHAWHFRGHLLDVAPQNRREVGIDHRGVAPADEFHQGAGLVRGADLGEAQLLRQGRRLRLMRGIAVTMHEHNGHAAQAAAIGGLQLRAQGWQLQGLQHLALSPHPLLRLDDFAVQQLRQDNVPVEQARSVLVGNAQGVAKPLGGDQQRGLALALEQGVGGHGGAHFDAGHLVGRDRLAGLQAQQVPNASNRGVAVLLGVLAQQLVREQLAIRALAHDVGERATSVNPESPLAAWIHRCFHLYV